APVARCLRRFAGRCRPIAPEFHDDPDRDLAEAEPQLAPNRVKRRSHLLASRFWDRVGRVYEQRGARLIAVTPPDEFGLELLPILREAQRQLGGAPLIGDALRPQARGSRFRPPVA